MAPIKSYTDMEQSQKLAEFLPIENADITLHVPIIGKRITEWDIPCWSLAALLNILPTIDDRNAEFCKDIRCDKWHIYYHATATLPVIDTDRYENLVDACYEMILKLHKLKML